jgi:7-alpha-hydroxysteroid dehydrogenase
MTDGRLAGRVTIVTGASRGLGRAIARAFAAEGASVIIAARTESATDSRMPGSIHDVVTEIQDAGGVAKAVACNVASDDDLVRLVDAAHAVGPVDILVNNAALTIAGAPGRTPAPAGRGLQFVDFPAKAFRRSFDVNFFAAFRLMQLVLPEMIERRSGSILNITAYAGEGLGEAPYANRGPTTVFAYGASKAALNHLTQSVAYEAGRHGISVAALAPSLAVPTPGMLASQVNWNSTESEEDFAEAAVRIAITPVDKINGRIAYSQDILHPELGRRGWMGS